MCLEHHPDKKLAGVVDDEEKKKVEDYFKQIQEAYGVRLHMHVRYVCTCDTRECAVCVIVSDSCGGKNIMAMIGSCCEGVGTGATHPNYGTCVEVWGIYMCV